MAKRVSFQGFARFWTDTQLFLQHISYFLHWLLLHLSPVHCPEPCGIILNAPFSSTNLLVCLDPNAFPVINFYLYCITHPTFKKLTSNIQIYINLHIPSLINTCVSVSPCMRNTYHSLFSKTHKTWLERNTLKMLKDLHYRKAWQLLLIYHCPGGPSWYNKLENKVRCSPCRSRSWLHR